MTFQTAVKVTKPGGTVSNTGYFGEGEFVNIPRVEWGVGMADKTIATGLCPAAGCGWSGCCGCWKAAASTRR